MKVFLDANVIADWIILKNKNPTEENRVLFDRYKKFENSFSLMIEKIIELRKRELAITSKLVLAEVFGVIFDNAINLKLFINGVPPASWYWESIRNREILNKDEIEEIYTGVTSKFDELFKNVALVEDHINLGLIGYLMLNFGVKPNDAVLISTAVENGSTHFATRDIRLIEIFKKISKKLGKDHFKKSFQLRVSTPEAILAELKK